MDDVSPAVLAAMSFAHSVARSYADRGGDPSELFGAFAGLIAEQDAKVATVTLKALDDALSNRDLRPTADR